MNPEQIISLFGHSELGPEIQELFRQLEVPIEQQEMTVCWRRYEPAHLDMLLVFLARTNFYYDYGLRGPAYTQHHDEGFLEEISFGSHKGLKTYPYPLPFGLCLGDSPDMVKKKMPVKGTKPSEASYGRYQEFFTEDLQVLTGFNREEELIWVRVKLLEKDFKKKRELKKNLKKQDRNISAVHTDELLALQSKPPTLRWTQRMQEGDHQFTPENIAAAAEALHRFIGMLLAAMQQKKAGAVHAAVKKAVLALNKLNEKYDSFIETLEREELGDYIHEAVRLTGFVLEEGLDLTEEWREW